MVKNLLVSQSDRSYDYKNYGLFIELAVALEIFMSARIAVLSTLDRRK